MNLLSRAATACCPALLLLCTASGQHGEAVRDRALGLAQRADGTPWSGARVRLLHRTHPADVAVADVVDTVTDERGRWRADVLAGQEYAVWAHGVVVDGAYRCSQLAVRVQAGMPIVLVEEPESRLALRVRCKGLDAWAACAPLRIVVRDQLYGRTNGRRDRADLREGVEPDEDGNFALPILPSRQVWLEVWGREGRPIYRQRVSRTAKGIAARMRRADPEGREPEPAALARRCREPYDVEIPPPYPLLVECVDQASGRAVAGVRIETQSTPDTPYGVVATTNGAGRAVVELALPRRHGAPQPSSWGELFLYADGFADGFATLRDVTLCSDAEQLTRIAAGEPDLRYELLPGKTLTGRLMSSAERPASDKAVLLYARISQGGGRSRGVDVRVTRTGPDGRFAFMGRPADHDYRLTVLVDPELRAALRGIDDPWLASEGFLAVGRGGGDLGSLRLDRAEVLRFELKEPDGVPAAFADVRLTELTGDLWHPVSVTADRVGRAAVLTLVSDPLALLCSSPRGSLIRTLEAGANGRREALSLTLDGEVSLRGVVVNRNGIALPGARVQLVGMRALAQHPHPDLVHAIARLTSSYAVPRVDVEADARGCFRLVLPCRDILLDLSLGAGGTSERIEHEWRTGDGDQPIRFHIDAPDPPRDR